MARPPPCTLCGRDPLFSEAQRSLHGKRAQRLSNALTSYTAPVCLRHSIPGPLKPPGLHSSPELRSASACVVRAAAQPPEKLA